MVFTLDSLLKGDLKEVKGVSSCSSVVLLLESELIQVFLSDGLCVVV